MPAEPPAASGPESDLVTSDPSAQDRGAAWHLCGVGAKD
jgi:hypothetical protein